jgi:aminoglycoside phosphotransferase (APT) family kinase protein
MHAVDLIGPNGERRQVVVRRYGAWRLDAEPRVAEREWAVLAVLARAGVPVPRPIWLDNDGAIFGVPTIVISRVPGRGLLAPRDVDGWVRQLAEALGRIHATPLDEAELELLLDQRAKLADLLERDAPPPDLANQPLGPEVWSTMRRWWSRIDVPTPSLLHGDYWPGNTLWRYGRLTGVVDWEQARRGNPAQDVACCRLDLTFLAGPEAAEAFLRAYQAAAGRTIRDLFFWDLYTATWAMGEVEHWVAGYHDLGRTDVKVEDARTRLARFTAAALARSDRGSGEP